jgi:predicted amidohydrolase
LVGGADSNLVGAPGTTTVEIHSLSADPRRKGPRRSRDPVATRILTMMSKKEHRPAQSVQLVDEGQGQMQVEDEFLVVERTFSPDPSKISVGLANIAAEVPNVEANKAKILRALRIFKERGANMVAFPEFCLSGYFWDSEDCWDYMDTAVTDEHLDWLEQEVKPLLDDDFRVVIMNNVRRGPERKYFNTTFILSSHHDHDVLDPEFTYNKVFLPGIEKRFTESGRDDRLVVTRKDRAKVGFTTCYDYLFQDLLREYVVKDGVQGIVQLASWRGVATRDYPGLNIRTDTYYGQLWDWALGANSAMNQVWTIACNAVGQHPISGARFWGGSGIWAPSGIKLVQASHFNEELLIVHNIDFKGALETEKNDFNYEFDFREIYRPMEGGRSYTRDVDL